MSFSFLLFTFLKKKKKEKNLPSLAIDCRVFLVKLSDWKITSALTLSEWMLCTLAVHLTLASAYCRWSLLRSEGRELLIVKDHIVVAFN